MAIECVSPQGGTGNNGNPKGTTEMLKSLIYCVKMDTVERGR